jgi:hypothetical protein
VAWVVACGPGLGGRPKQWAADRAVLRAWPAGPWMQPDRCAFLACQLGEEGRNIDRSVWSVGHAVLLAQIRVSVTGQCCLARSRSRRRIRRPVEDGRQAARKAGRRAPAEPAPLDPIRDKSGNAQG